MAKRDETGRMMPTEDLAAGEIPCFPFSNTANDKGGERLT